MNCLRNVSCVPVCPEGLGVVHSRSRPFLTGYVTPPPFEIFMDGNLDAYSLWRSRIIDHSPTPLSQHLSQCDSFGRFPLDLAILALCAPMVERLIADGADPRLSGLGSGTALHALAGSAGAGAGAGAGGGAGAVCAILMQHVAPNETNNRGETALHLAIRGSSAEVVQALLFPTSGEAASPFARGRDGVSAAELAMESDDQAIIALILRAVTTEGTPDTDALLADLLRHAASAGAVQATAMLISAGAPVRSDSLGWSPVHLAARAGAGGVLAAVLRSLSDDAALALASAPTRRHPGGGVLYALGLACRAGSPLCVALLLRAGVAVDVTDRLQWTAAHYAAESADPVSLALLLLAGSPPAAADGDGLTPLCKAAEIGATECVELLTGSVPSVFRSADLGHARELRREGVLPRLRPEDAGALSAAALAPRVSDTDFLILLYQRAIRRAGGGLIGQPERTFKQGYTCLHFSAQNGHESVVRILLAAGVSPGAKGAGRWSPGDLAAKSGHMAIAKMLRDAQYSTEPCTKSVAPSVALTPAAASPAVPADGATVMA